MRNFSLLNGWLWPTDWPRGSEISVSCYAGEEALELYVPCAALSASKKERRFVFANYSTANPKHEVSLLKEVDQDPGAAVEPLGG